MKVSVDSEHDKVAILHKCTKLRSKDNPDDIQKVYITPDLTPREQQENKVLRSKLAEMNKTEKKYGIKTAGLCRGVTNTFPLHIFTHCTLHSDSSFLYCTLNCFLTNAKSFGPWLPKTIIIL